MADGESNAKGKGKGNIQATAHSPLTTDTLPQRKELVTLSDPPLGYFPTWLQIDAASLPSPLLDLIIIYLSRGVGP